MDGSKANDILNNKFNILLRIDSDSTLFPENYKQCCIPTHAGTDRLILGIISTYYFGYFFYTSTTHRAWATIACAQTIQ
jgi:hypothetical protein